jgi:hypothetical protein
VSGVEPVGSSHRYMVKVTLPSAAGTTVEVEPTSVVWPVDPSHDDPEVGSRSHSSNLRASPGAKTVLGPIVTVMTPASPRYCSVAENWACVFVTGFGVRLDPVGGTDWAEAGPATAVRAANTTEAATRPNFLILLFGAKVSSFVGLGFAGTEAFQARPRPAGTI